MSAAPTTAVPGRRVPPRDVLIIAAAVFLAFGSTFAQLVRLWNGDTNYSHGWLIPLFAAIPAYLYVRRTGIPDLGNRPLGLMYVVAGGLMHLVAQTVSMPPLDFIALFCALRGAAIAAGGREWAAGFTFPLAFLFFMFPLPHSWTGYSSIWLQDIVSRVSEIALEPFLTVYRQGNSLHVAGVEQPLAVAEECSGLRQIIAFVACGAYIAYFSGRGRVIQLLLVLAAIPVAIAANVLRIALMAFASSWYGTNWLNGQLHDAPALFSIPMGLALYLLLARTLGMFQAAPAKEASP